MRGTVTGDRGNNWLTVNLLQMVMVSPRTHLVKNFESQSRTNESQFKKKKKESETENAWGYRLQNSVLQCHSILKLKIIIIVLLFKSTRLKEICIIKQQS